MGIDRTPKTWGAEELTSTDLNAEVKALWTGLQAAWTSYTPSWTASSNPGIGNGTNVGTYWQVGKTIKYRITITMGSTTTFGSGTWAIGLPVAASSGSAAFDAFGNGLARKASGSYYPVTAVRSSSASALNLYVPSSSSSTLMAAATASAPFAWGSGDILTIRGEYEAA